MSNTTGKIQRHLKLIIETLREHADGLSVGEIADLLSRKKNVSLAPHNVAYRIRQAPPHLIHGFGDGRGRRYRLAKDADVTTPIRAREVTPADATKGPREWLTPESLRLRALIHRPRGERTYVGYNRAWLASYEPNVTAFLTEGTRDHLRRLGRTPEGERPAGTFARDILSRLLIDLSWASSRLEGNTYSRLDTQNLIEFGQRAEGKDALEAQMILNHKRAIEFIVSAETPVTLNEFTIRSLHALLSEDLLPNPADEGRLRLTPVSITGTTYVPTEDPHVIRESFALLVQKANAIIDPIERAFFLLVQLPYLQPFVDVNKRTSRLAANIPLVEANLCPLTFVDVPEQDYVDGVLAIYEHQQIELLRDVFVRAYERSCEQYVVVRQAAPSPDPIRLRYRAILGAVIAHMVRERQAPARETILRLAAAHPVREEDRARFGELALNILLNLNDASATNYGVRPSEFETWRAAYRE